MESITNDSVEQKPIATPKLAAALCKFQMEYSNAVRDASGNFGSYVSLSEAEYAVSPATKFGLSHTFIIESATSHADDHIIWITCRIMHESGEYIDSRLPVVTENQRGQNIYHKMGSAITYARRYMLLAAYGLGQADDEADAFSQKCADADNTGKARNNKTSKPKFQVSTTKPPKGQEKISEKAFAQLRAELNSRPDKKQIMDNFKNKFYPSVDKLLANHIELTIHEEFLREQMTKSTEKK
jgi:hypothetical protein